MPKHKKEKTGPGNRHQPLATQMSDDGSKPRKQRTPTAAAGVGEVMAGNSSRRRERADGKRNDELDDDEGDEYLAPEMSKRILEQAREQRDEIAKEGVQGWSGGGVGRGRIPEQGQPAIEESEGEGENDNYSDDDMGEGDEGGDYMEGIGMSEAEETLVANFMSSAPIQRRSLADIIMEKIREKEEREARAAMGDEDDDREPELPAKVKEVYGAIGKLLKTYTAGKLPKAFKIIPSLTNWEQVLWLTSPYEWSPHAVLAATKIFASNFNPRMAQRFYNVILLERCRDDIRENNRLNYHLYEAARKVR
ncbi:unnamed protein product [Choristocarpus tenellus]